MAEKILGGCGRMHTLKEWDRCPECNRPQQYGRLALRVEGDNWVAYYAKADTMKDALLLGSIKMALIDSNPKHKQAFMELMKGCVSDILEKIVGTRPVWNKPKDAPEAERSKE
jgi:hypothetical protein